MKKLFASASYTFNNFYNNLNIQGQMVFSIIIILILILTFVLMITYIVEFFKKKKRFHILKNSKTDEIKKIEEIKEEVKEIKKEKEPLYFNEKTEIEDIAKRVEDALKEDAPITLTNFEEDQERTAIISIDELMKRAKELELIDDREVGTVNYLEKYNLEPSEIKEAVENTVNVEKPKEVKAFKVSQVISPIYGIKKEVVDNNNN